MGRSEVANEQIAGIPLESGFAGALLKYQELREMIEAFS